MPLRQTMEAAGFSVVWNSKEAIATVSDGDGTKVYVKIGDNFITKEKNNNGTIESSRIKNDTFAQVVNHRTYLPIRAVLECFGASVSWSRASRNVIVNTEGESSSVLDAEQIYARYSSAIFYIEIYDVNGVALSSGSGFFIDSSGTAITNYHVIEGGSSAKIMTTDGTVYDVEGVYAFDKTLDIAKLKIKGSGFNFVNIARTGNVLGGSKTYAIGSPLGLDNTISEGIISNPNRIFDDISYYQITTPISPGSSGGALFDKNGNVIGITCGGITEGQNLNLAIPITNISKLTNATVSKLSTVASLKTNNDVTFLASKSNISLQSGKSEDIIMSYTNTNYDPEVECNYYIGDESIVAVTWGEWKENKIPLKITGIRKGKTTITITLSDCNSRKVLSTQTIQVSVSQGNSTPYYDGLYPAPDFGAIFGIPLYYTEQSSEGILYFYSQSDLNYASPNSDFISDYGKIVLANGFVFEGKFDDEYGEIVHWYSNNYYDLNIYAINVDLDGVKGILVMVCKE